MVTAERRMYREDYLDDLWFKVAANHHGMIRAVETALAQEGFTFSSGQQWRVDERTHVVSCRYKNEVNKEIALVEVKYTWRPTEDNYYEEMQYLNIF